jgi:type IV fimbrial biogenesis protein FimT
MGRHDDADHLLDHQEGRHMLTRRAPGFTIIELMIGIALLGILLVLAMPSFTQMIQNMKLRGSAEAIAHGLQDARAEALRRNVPIEFLLTDDDPVAASVAGANVNTIGPNWMIRARVGAGAYQFIEGRAGREGQGQAEGATLNVQVAAAVPTLPGMTADAVTFNAVGRAELASNATFVITNPSGGACKAAGGPMTCLNVVVTPGGRVRMCNPDPSIAVDDSRRC